MASRFKACVTYYKRGKRAKRVCKGLSIKGIKKLMKLPKGVTINNFFTQ